ncbi:hypothetical protein V501_03935 [Pseudogymnoascus sp. VKM F-4519 (FW-2642)]|nr:hypothetical protein V501_03935 [Pseudogymnoascus sp. VKM F-4519 (FW-2642)]
MPANQFASYLGPKYKTQLGRTIAQALIEASFTVNIVSRASSTFATHAHPSAIFKCASYESTMSLEEALQDQDAIVEAFNPIAAAYQDNILRAAIRMGVKHIITPDFSSDTFNPQAHELRIFEPKLCSQTRLESLASQGKIYWTAIIVGPFYDWAISRGLFWVNNQDRKITLFGSGNQRISMSALSIVGRATVAVLQHPKDFVNRPAYFADYTISTNELIALWTLYENGSKLWDKDTDNGLKDRLSTPAYVLLGTFEEDSRYGADFGTKVEPGWEKPRHQLKQDLNKLLLD